MSSRGPPPPESSLCPRALCLVPEPEGPRRCGARLAVRRRRPAPRHPPAPQRGATAAARGGSRL
eukprot:15459313-Alexandrium_andersonii.AAC.1